MSLSVPPQLILRTLHIPECQKLALTAEHNGMMLEARVLNL